MTRWTPVAIGAAGAATVTLLNEGMRRIVPHAPRMDVIGMRAIARPMREMDQEPPEGDRLFWLAMAGDLLSNTLYYSLAGVGPEERIWGRGIVLGLAAGLGAAVLPEPLGLGRQPGARWPVTHVMTVGWYLAGGLAAAATARALARSGSRP